MTAACLRRALATGVFAVPLAVARVIAALPCADPAADPCVLASTATIPVGFYDIRPKSLSVANRTITVSGAGELRILATNVVMQPGARFVAPGSNGATTVTLDATATLELRSQGTSKSRIDVSGNFGGGAINLRAGGNLTVDGTLVANATNQLGFGGPISITSDTGNVTITGDPSEGVRSFGNAQGGGGAITVEATLGTIAVSTQLVAKGGDCSSCEVNLSAGTNIVTTAQGVVDLRASGIGDGGFFSATAGGNVTLAGNVFANGSSDELEGGAGGDVLVSANGSVTMSGRVELNGAGRDEGTGNTTGSVDGDGGTVDVSAGTSIHVSGPMFGISKGFGQGDEFAFDALGDVTLAAEIDQSGDQFGGDVSVSSDGLVTVSARVRTATPNDPVNKPSALGGTIELAGCRIAVTAGGQVIATGPGGTPSGANLLSASTGLTIAGALVATSENELSWRTSAPVITGSVSPGATILQVSGLPCCGVACSVPTTTTTTTTTSSAPFATTTSSGVPTTLASTSSTTSTSTSSSTSTSTTTTSSTTSTTSSTSTSTTTSTSTSSTTSTTLVAACPAAPAPGCTPGARVKLVVNEKRFGNEQIALTIDELAGEVPAESFGDPVGGGTGYAICLYDQADVLVAALRVHRAGQQCGKRACWSDARGRGYKYGDKLLAADGVLQLVLKGGASGAGKVMANAKRNLRKGLMALPVAVAPKLTGHRRATAQLIVGGGCCFHGTLARVREANGSLFKATTP